jgi:hypothetical protein
LEQSWALATRPENLAADPRKIEHGDIPGWQTGIGQRSLDDTLQPDGRTAAFPRNELAERIKLGK